MHKGSNCLYFFNKHVTKMGQAEGGDNVRLYRNCRSFITQSQPNCFLGCFCDNVLRQLDFFLFHDNLCMCAPLKRIGIYAVFSANSLYMSKKGFYRAVTRDPCFGFYFGWYPNGQQNQSSLKKSKKYLGQILSRIPMVGNVRNQTSPSGFYQM